MTALWKQLNTRFFLPYYLMATGVLFGHAGNKHEAQTHLGDSLAMADETGMNFWRAETMRHVALLELNPNGRREGLREALETARTQQAFLYELRIALDLAGLDHPGAEADLEQALAHLGQNTSYPEVGRAQALLATQE
jgi:hypothetical protein